MPRPDKIMENKNNHNHNNGGNGFLLGVIVGVLATLLFTTKRGRAILKEVMEKGIDKFANLEELMRETEDDFDDEEGDDYIPAEPIETPAPQQVKKETVKKPVEAAPPVKQELQTKKVEFLDEAPVEKETPEEEPVEVKQEEEKPPARNALQSDAGGKETRVKRLFRGLRKKS